MKKHQKSFTLIELLVVISIFGLLASVIIVSTQSARDKARIAKALTFSATIYHSLGVDMVGWWRFEEGSGGTVADSSGNNNNSTLYSGGSVCNPPCADCWEQNSVYQLGKTGKFGPAHADCTHVIIPDSNSLNVKDGIITIEAWIKTNKTNDWTVVSKPNFYRLGVNNLGEPIFYVLAGVGTFTCPGEKPFVVGQWHHYVGTYNLSKMRIFVDGKEICPPRDFNTQIAGITGLLYIGVYDNALSSMFNGDIDEVRIYSRGLTPAQIQKHYAEGAKKRGIAIE